MTTLWVALPRDDVGARPEPEGERPQPRSWPRLMATCLLITGLVFIQAPGLTVPDTKLDLTVNPWGFLERALHLWEPTGFFGQVQNQAYGYLFPMGPVFGVGDLLNVPGWVVQRVWWAGILCLAFVGVERLTTALGVGMPWTRWAAAVLYALSPRMMTMLGPSSVELLPMALAPWVTLPLVHGSTSGSPRRAAGLSALVALALGGVNAVASLAALVPAGLYLLTRSSGPRRRQLAGWWVTALALATAWWLLPLLVLGRYSPPFLDWIESAPVTTSVTSIASALRGVSAWVAYVPVAGQDLPASWQLLTDPAVVLHTMLVVCVGLLGLALPGLRERAWLLSCLLVGLLAVTAGHVGAVDGALAEPIRSALDGALAPFRNTHKFDLVLRIALAVGTAHALAWGTGLVTRRARDGRALVPGPVRASAAALTAVVVLTAVAPALTLRLAPHGSYTQIPGYWSSAAEWLGQHDDGRALVVPGASFGTYVWGHTRDEPLQPLAQSPWAVRDAVPLTPPGTIRVLDAVQRRLATGVGSAGLSSLLARMGVSHLVVRNDLDPVASGAPTHALVEQALRDSPGLTLTARFGPAVGTTGSDRLLLDDGLDAAPSAVEIWSVNDAQPVVSVVPESDVLRVSGGPESLLDLSDRGLNPARPVVLAGNTAPGTPAPPVDVVTDGLRRREVNFGRVDDNYSFTLSRTDPVRGVGVVRDYLPFDGPETRARWNGVAGVVASSSAGDATTWTPTDQSHQPYAAVDGDPRTTWQSGSVQGAVGQWLEVRFRAPVDPRGSTLTVAEDEAGTVPKIVRVTTDAGSVDQLVVPGVSRTLAVPPGSTSRLRVTLLETATPSPGNGFAVAELSVPGVKAARPLVTPAVGRSAVLTTSDSRRVGCVAEGSDWVCPSGLARDGEETVGLDRVVHLLPGRYLLSVTVLPRPGAALDKLLDNAVGGPPVSASSTSSVGPAVRPGAALDGVMATGWIAAAGDLTPSLRVDLPGPRTLTSVRVRTADAAPASAPTSVVVSGDSGVRQGQLGPDGVLRMRPLRTSSVTLSFPTVHARRSYDVRTGESLQLPVGVSELDLAGPSGSVTASSRTASRAPVVVDVPCGSGPTVQVGDRRRRLALRTTSADIVAGRPVVAKICGGALEGRPAGATRTRVRMRSTDTWLARAVDLVDPRVASAVGTAPMDTAVVVNRWDADARVVSVGARSTESLLVVRENVNDGWQASLDGQALQPQTVDGWQQGWLLPSGAAGQVRLDYQPDTLYRGSLGLGLLAAMALVILVLLRDSRRYAGLHPFVPPAWLLAMLATLAMWLLAGWVGGLVLVAGLAVARLLPERWSAVGCGVGACAVGGVAALALAAWPWGERSYSGDAAVVQIACVIALSLVVGAVVEQVRRSRLSGVSIPPASAGDARLET